MNSLKIKTIEAARVSEQRTLEKMTVVCRLLGFNEKLSTRPQYQLLYWSYETSSKLQDSKIKYKLDVLAYNEIRSERVSGLVGAVSVR